MTAYSWFIQVWPALILLPVAAAYVACLMPARGGVIGLLVSLVNVATTIVLAWHVLRHGVLRHTIGGWEAPLGITLHVDGMAALMLLTSALTALAAGIYASVYFSSTHPGEQRCFWPLWLFLLGALNLLFVAADLFNLYVTLELMGIAAVALVAMGGGRSGVTAALRYLFVGLAGSLCYLLGVGLIYAAHASVNLQDLAGITPSPAVSVALALMTGGLLFKAGLFPFHFWLPPAHAKAPAPVSAMLSALVVEAAFYLLLRLWFELAPVSVIGFAQLLIGGLGAAAVVWGAVNALRAKRLKMMVAYSTVSQLGYLFLAITLMLQVGFSAWSGALLLILSHALAKGAMFLAAGTILQVAGHDRITELPGMAQRLPLTMLTFALAGVSLIGLPPSGGFLAKWMLLTAALESNQWWVVVVLLSGSLLGAAYIFRVISVAFMHIDGADRNRLISRALEWPTFALAVAAVLLGLFGSGVVELVAVGSPLQGPLLGEGAP